jgi:hypothetical protein
MILLSFAIKTRLRSEISPRIVALPVVFFETLAILAVASFLILLGGRLLAGCFLHSPRQRGRT